MDKYIAAFRGGVRLEITGANPEKVLNRCTQEGIEFITAVPSDDFTVSITVKRKDSDKVYIISERCMCSVQKVSESGIPVKAKKMQKRHAFFVIPLLLTLLLVWSSLRVWEINIVGNTEVPDGEILLALENAGVTVGSFWPSFVSDNIRSRVMVQIPKLRWLAVNISGSCAEVVVRERVEKPKIFDWREKIHIVAEKSGVVTKILAYNGQTMINSGQTVEKGDVLVSGLVQSTLAPIRTEHAKAEIWARTWYELVAAAPVYQQRKIPSEKEHTIFSMILGDKRINFYHNSGKTGEDYDRINSEYGLSIAGVFYVPFKLMTSRIQEYHIIEAELDHDLVAEGLKKQLVDELSERIREDGSISDTAFSTAVKDGILYLTLRAECIENIAHEREITYAELAEVTEGPLPGEEISEDD